MRQDNDKEKNPWFLWTVGDWNGLRLKCWAEERVVRRSTLSLAEQPRVRQGDKRRTGEEVLGSWELSEAQVESEKKGTTESTLSLVGIARDTWSAEQNC